MPYTMETVMVNKVLTTKKYSLCRGASVLNLLMEKN